MKKKRGKKSNTSPPQRQAGGLQKSLAVTASSCNDENGSDDDDACPVVVNDTGNKFSLVRPKKMSDETFFAGTHIIGYATGLTYGRYSVQLCEEPFNQYEWRTTS